MKLPYYENAVVAQQKIIDYLLSETHEDGKSKAVFFVRFGFSVAQLELMRSALLEHVAVYEVASILDTARGKHYVIEGGIATPSGRMPFVRTVWMLETDSETPRFITAYPLKQRA